MINKQDREKQAENNKIPLQKPKKPNEVNSLHVEGFVKIYDPNTKEIYLESRA